MPTSEPSRPWWDISWVDWVAVIGTILALAGIVVALIGIRQAWRQAKNAVNAAEAAAAASGAMQRQIQANQLLVLIPQLQRISAELDLSIQQKSPSFCVRTLSSWRFQVSAVRGVLTAGSEDVGELLVAIQKSVTLAATAATRLLEDPPDVFGATRQARHAIGTVCDELTAWSGKTALTPEIEVAS